MRILHITPDYYPAKGGGELYIKEVSERLARRGHHVTVVAMDSRGISGRNGHELKAREVIGQVNVSRLTTAYRLHERVFGLRGTHRLLGLMVGADRLAMLSTSPFSLRAFLVTLRANVDVVAVANWYHGSLAYQTCAARHRRSFALVGIPFFHTEREWANSPLFTPMLERCDAIVAMTEHERRFIERRSLRCHPHVVGAGVEPSLFAKADGRRIRATHGIGDAPLVGYVGRMSASKGVVTLLRAMQIVWRDRPDAWLLLAGSGLSSGVRGDDEMRCAFANLSSAERSRVVAIDSFGEEDKASIFDALDVFAMVSVAESFGIAYLEAWMCGKPVIGSRIESTACVIREGVDGELVAPSDPEALAQSIVRLLSDQAAREQMGAAGRAKALAHFTWDRIADKIEHIYRTARAKKDAAERPLAGAVA